MVNNAVALPVMLPLMFAAVAVLLRKRQHLQHNLSLVGALGLLVLAIWLLFGVIEHDALSDGFGSWALPYAIMFRIDRLSIAMLIITAIMLLVTLIYMRSRVYSDDHPLVLPLVFGLIAGVNGAFITADLFNWYVWFEVMLICSLGLLAIGRRGAHLDAAFKYMALNLFGTLLMLFAVAMIYGATGHLNFMALREAMVGLPDGTRLWLLTLLAVSFLVKAGAFPVFAWLPASYHTLPSPLLALFAALLTKVGVYGLLRSLGDVFVPSIDVLQDALACIAVATMVFGVLGAAYHWDMRRILAFHIISQIGYILLAVALGGVAGNSAAVFYTVHHIIVKANLFFVAGIICVYAGSYDLRNIGGLYNAKPLLAVLFAIPAMSLVGIPPFSGFWAKLLILQETVAGGYMLWTIAAVVVSILTMYSMMKIWFEAFCKAHPQAAEDQPWTAHETRMNPALITASILGLLTLWISLFPNTLYQFSEQAARSLGGP
ncbi:hypothetical protein L0B52_06705 [Suttonella sp. R2A3]|uniref:complex I subunit 5 family protein n=1 Tax=Suttonella sp. R2A3 TaxID=2908648 RepID=UPI001F42AC48|nr:proton-conducting transporter membrane subunit [Suttonella sp. R2A3]UJF24027.1 hypothetical protein L0B52_06705 [Suttonella sp. R2A3]